jgi:ABC-2 type transport system permease protein
MALQPPAPPATPAARLRWALADGRTIVRRNLTHLRTQPGELIGELVFPAIMVVLFGYIFGSRASEPRPLRSARPTLWRWGRGWLPHR